ncbi:hypothetical protein A2U01_0093287, partial [Trifolium medium]|nr:hypothetical protein [Trifolium medium]
MAVAPVVAFSHSHRALNGWPV